MRKDAHPWLRIAVPLVPGFCGLRHVQPCWVIPHRVGAMRVRAQGGEFYCAGHDCETKSLPFEVLYQAHGSSAERVRAASLGCSTPIGASSVKPRADLSEVTVAQLNVKTCSERVTIRHAPGVLQAGWMTLSLPYSALKASTAFTFAARVAGTAAATSAAVRIANADATKASTPGFPRAVR